MIGDRLTSILGPRIDGDGVTFGLMSVHATAVDLVLLEGSSRRVVPMRPGPDAIWSASVPGAGPGTQYGFSVHGPWDPGGGHRFDPGLLLLDPCARAVAGKHSCLSGAGDSRPRSIVVADDFDWRNDRPPAFALSDMVIYELHVGGFTRHSTSGVQHPGTFWGVIEKIDHLLRIGVNAVELLPIQEFHTEARLERMGLVNYWGYNPIALFAPESSYSTGREPGCQVEEFKTMVRELHRAGIEVILDIVFNHTGEQDHLGPTLCFRGIDNATYYQLEPGDRSRYVNWTGCGNTLDFTRPQVVDFAVQCLEYWVQCMHVDGFRFDLAPVMGRDRNGTFDPQAPFFRAVASDPVLAGVKFIAEPWDLHPSSPDQSGRFPSGWAEWNGRFRDDVRSFVKGDGGTAGRMGCRLTGSADIHPRPDHKPSRSVNFVTCHDGFTLFDLFAYDVKHNDSNGEQGRDGTDDNRSWNCGVEGPSLDPLVCELRKRLSESLVSTLLFSRGVPMLMAGDEMLRTQRGNNNAYCQDNEVSWVDWSCLDRYGYFVDFVGKLIRLRRAHPVLRGLRYAEGKDHDCDMVADIEWYGALLEKQAHPSPPRWNEPETRSLAFRLDGSECPHPDGTPDEDIFVVLNPHHQECFYPIPSLPTGSAWLVLLDTSLPAGREWHDEPARLDGAAPNVRINPRSVLLAISG